MSSPVYVQRGAAWRDSFVYVQQDGTLKTGLVQADFTIKLSKDGTGGQSTTGITITEVSSANNPGEYAVYVPTTSFVAADGAYVLTITRTSDPFYTWSQTLTVNATGSTLAATPGFTATASDGRCVSAGSPLAGVSIHVTNGTAHYAFTTDSDGLWGPVYLIAGTWQVTAQRSSYQTATGTLVSNGVTITGIGADLSLTAIGTGTVLASALFDYARRAAFDITGERADEEIKAAVNDALAMVATERNWPYYLRRAWLTLHAAQTVAVTVSGSTATITGTWPTWAGTGRLFFNGQVSDIGSRDSDTVCTLASAWGGSSYTGDAILFENEIALPVEAVRFHRILPGQRWGYPASPVSPEHVYAAESAATYGQRLPDCFAIAGGKVVLWPYPTESTSVAYTYYAKPASIVSEEDVPDFDNSHLDLVHRAIDYQVATHTGKSVMGDAASCYTRYREALARAATSDKQPTVEDGMTSLSLGNRNDLAWRRR